MGKNKKRNRWNSQPRKQENPLAQQQKMVAPKAVRDYWANNLTPDEQELFNTPIAVAQQAGVMQRLGYLTAAYLHIHSVQSLLFGEMQNIVEDWGLLIKGVQPVINSLLNSEDKFFNVMHDLVKTRAQASRRPTPRTWTHCSTESPDGKEFQRSGSLATNRSWRAEREWTTSSAA